MNRYYHFVEVLTDYRLKGYGRDNLTILALYVIKSDNKREVNPSRCGKPASNSAGFGGLVNCAGTDGPHLGGLPCYNRSGYDRAHTLGVARTGNLYYVIYR
jgi:hypothetical protein